MNFRKSDSRKSVKYLKTNNYSINNNNIELLKKLFNDIDIDNKGYWTPIDLRNIFEKINVNLNKNEIFSILCDYDSSESGCFTFEDFLNMVSNKTQPYQNDTDNDFLQVFKTLDSHNNGFLNKETLIEGFNKYGIKINKDEVDNIFVKLNKNEINLEDFKKIIKEFTQKWNNKNNNIKNFN